MTGIKNSYNFDDIKQWVKRRTLEEKKSFLRGVFLGCGILSNPPNYHLEFRFEKKPEQQFVSSIIREFDIKYSTGDSHIYVKGRENIKAVLHLMGSVEVYLTLEEDAVIKEMTNTANREANFEFANLKRQTASATEQLKILEKIKANGLLEKMREDLREVAELRLSYPYLSLNALSEKTKGKYSKQSIYYRLKKIMRLYGEQE